MSICFSQLAIWFQLAGVGDAKFSFAGFNRGQVLERRGAYNGSNKPFSVVIRPLGALLDLLSITKDRGHQPRIPAPVENPHNPKLLVRFLGRFGRDAHFHAATVRLRRLPGKVLRPPAVSVLLGNDLRGPRTE